MADILHRVGTKSSLDEVYKALTTREGLAGWWTEDTKGESKVGGVIQFRFSEGGKDIGGFDVKVLELRPDKRVLWEVVEGPKEWIGTKISWELKQEDGFSIVMFKHQDWKEPVEFMHHCSTKWAIFLMSLKSLVETGKGAPSPHDTKISYELRQEDDYSILLFKHQDWKEPVEFMHHCSTKWGVFLMSLKSLLETGTGAPYPDDVKIDNWN